MYLLSLLSFLLLNNRILNSAEMEQPNNQVLNATQYTLLACQCYSELLINDKHETELNNRMEWNWDHFHRFRHCPLIYILLLK